MKSWQNSSTDSHDKIARQSWHKMRWHGACRSTCVIMVKSPNAMWEKMFSTNVAGCHKLNCTRSPNKLLSNFLLVASLHGSVSRFQGSHNWTLGIDDFLEDLRVWICAETLEDVWDLLCAPQQRHPICAGFFLCFRSKGVAWNAKEQGQVLEWQIFSGNVEGWWCPHPIVRPSRFDQITFLHAGASCMRATDGKNSMILELYQVVFWLKGTNAQNEFVAPDTHVREEVC